VQKKVFKFGFISFLLIVLAAVVLPGCAGRPVIIATDEPVVSSQISAARIEAVNEGIRSILRDYDVFIETAIARAVRGNLDAEAALDQYDEFVQGLIRKIRELEFRTRPVESEISNLIQNSNGGLDTVPD